MRETLGFPASLQPPNSMVWDLPREWWLSTLLSIRAPWKGVCPPGSCLLDSACFSHFLLQGCHPGSRSAHSLFQMTFRRETGAEIRHPPRQSWPKSLRLGEVTAKSQSPTASGLFHPPFTLPPVIPLPPSQMPRCSRQMEVQLPRRKRWIFFWSNGLSWDTSCCLFTCRNLARGCTGWVQGVRIPKVFTPQGLRTREKHLSHF